MSRSRRRARCTRSMRNRGGSKAVVPGLAQIRAAIDTSSDHRRCSPVANPHQSGWHITVMTAVSNPPPN